MFYFAYFDPLSPPPKSKKHIYLLYYSISFNIFHHFYFFVTLYIQKRQAYACLKENQMAVSESSKLIY